MILNFLLDFLFFLIGTFIGVCLQDYVNKKISKKDKEDEWSNSAIRVMGYNYCNPNSRNSMWGIEMNCPICGANMTKFEEKACTSSITEKQRLDKEIDSLEANILEMQQALERVRID